MTEYEKIFFAKEIFVEEENRQPKFGDEDTKNIKDISVLTMLYVGIDKVLAYTSEINEDDSYELAMTFFEEYFNEKPNYRGATMTTDEIYVSALHTAIMHSIKKKIC